jgi:hypothetical protein
LDGRRSNHRRRHKTFAFASEALYVVMLISGAIAGITGVADLLPIRVVGGFATLSALIGFIAPKLRLVERAEWHGEFENSVGQTAQ